ncbi:MAG: type 4a pilus biogenesis protein PilO [Myxococcota bacterium]|jgi:type IV pilus assembly protein PilO
MEIKIQLQERLDQLGKLPKAARIGIVVALSILMGTGYYFGFYEARSEELDRLHAHELELQRKLSEVRSVAANIAAFEDEIEELQAKLTTALLQLPNKKQLEVLLTDISNLGKKAGVEIRSFKRNEEVVYDFYAEVPIDLVLEGEYHQIGKFFELMAALPRIVNMGALRVKVDRDRLEGTRLSVAGTATTFRFVGEGA